MSVLTTPIKCLLYKHEPLHWMMSLPSLAPFTSSAVLICSSNSVPFFWALPLHLWLQKKKKKALSVTRYYQALQKKAFWRTHCTTEKKNHVLLWKVNVGPILYTFLNVTSQSLIQVLHGDEMQGISLYYQVIKWQFKKKGMLIGKTRNYMLLATVLNCCSKKCWLNSTALLQIALCFVFPKHF